MYIYLDDFVGMALAKGTNSDFSSIEKNNSWLAVYYSYNDNERIIF